MTQGTLPHTFYNQGYSIKALLPGLIVLAVAGTAPADIIVFENFEDPTLTYTGPADAFGDLPGTRDYYGRFAADTVAVPNGISYSNIQGSGYYGVEDSNGATGGGGALNTVTLNWLGIDTSAFENLSLSWFVAEDDDGTQNDWDPDTSFRIEANLDGLGFNTVFQIESSSSTNSNFAPRVDTNFDGLGDGAEITDTFTQFSTALADADVVDIRVSFVNLTAQDEDLAFDNLLLEGDLVSTPVPEPSAFAIGLAGLLGGVIYRRRKVAAGG